MCAKRGGQVVTITSLAGQVAGEFISAYAASKFALEGWMEALRNEVAPYGITTTIVERGPSALSCSRRSPSFRPPLAVEDYAERTRQILPHWEHMNGKQSGDPAKLAHALVALLDSATPPQRWIAGSDAIAGVEQKAKTLLAQLDAHRTLSSSLAPRMPPHCDVRPRSRNADHPGADVPRLSGSR
jgi:NAD(P)-dependent dehydrogenase (short-subunit alcohol dehydrogenase family)